MPSAFVSLGMHHKTEESQLSPTFGQISLKLSLPPLIKKKQPWKQTKNPTESWHVIGKKSWPFSGFQAFQKVIFFLLQHLAFLEGIEVNVIKCQYWVCFSDLLPVQKSENWNVVRSHDLLDSMFLPYLPNLRTSFSPSIFYFKSQRLRTFHFMNLTRKPDPYGTDFSDLSWPWILFSYSEAQNVLQMFNMGKKDELL